MIQKIILENFMAHKRTELVLGPGMTVLTGPNNCGKSAVVEGLRCVVSNPAPRHFIRHGAKEARVAVVLEHGTTITWIRKKGTVIYEVDRPGDEEAEVFRKLRRGQVPDEVRDLLRLDPVELESGRLGERRVDVHIGNQRKPIFLLADDSADTRMAEFFAASSESAHLLSMQKNLKNRIREAKREEKRLIQYMGDLAVDLDRLTGLPGISLELSKALDLEQALEQAARVLPGLEQMLLEQGRLEQARQHSLAQKEQFSELREPPDVFDSPSLGSVIESLAHLRGQENVGQERLAFLALLVEPPELQSTTDLVDSIESAKRLKSKNKFYKDRVAFLDTLQDTPMLYDEQPLSGLVGEIETLQARSEKLSRVHRAQEAKLVELEEELRLRIKEIGDCPLCGSKLRAEALLGQEDA